jgi:hypothetical protein
LGPGVSDEEALDPDPNPMLFGLNQPHQSGSLQVEKEKPRDRLQLLLKRSRGRSASRALRIDLL